LTTKFRSVGVGRGWSSCLELGRPRAQELFNLLLTCMALDASAEPNRSSAKRFPRFNRVPKIDLSKLSKVIVSRTTPERGGGFERCSPLSIFFVSAELEPV